MRFKKILDLLKPRSSRKENIKIHKLAYITNTSFSGNNYIDRWCKIRNSHFGKYSYVGFCGDFNNVIVGNYCSISSDVKIGLGKHPINLFSTSPIFYSGRNPFDIKEQYKNFDDYPKKTIIENDVWIGANVIVMDNLRIGTGAIIAAGSIVTKDVNPYEIVGGVPAKVIKKRFDEITIQKLIKSEWWEYTPKQLKENKFDIDLMYKER